VHNRLPSPVSLSVLSRSCVSFISPATDLDTAGLIPKSPCPRPTSPTSSRKPFRACPCVAYLWPSLVAPVPAGPPTGQLCFLLPRNHLCAHAKEISSTSRGFRINRSHTPIQALGVAVYNPIFKKNSSTPCSRHARALPCSCAQLQRRYVAPLEASSSCCEGMTPLSLLPRVPLLALRNRSSLSVPHRCFGSRSGPSSSPRGVHPAPSPSSLSAPRCSPVCVMAVGQSHPTNPAATLFPGEASVMSSPKAFPMAGEPLGASCFARARRSLHGRRDPLLADLLSLRSLLRPRKKKVLIRLQKKQRENHPHSPALSLLGAAAQPSAPVRRALGASHAPASPPAGRRCCPALPHHCHAAAGCLPVFALCSRHLR
jgi:hypothetical protein